MTDSYGELALADLPITRTYRLVGIPMMLLGVFVLIIGKRKCTLSKYNKPKRNRRHYR